MSIMTADVGAIQMLTKYFKGTENFTLKLFVNDVTLADTLTAGSFTEAAGGGYAAKTITPAGVTVSNPGIPQALFAQQSFVFTGPLTTNPSVYGYYVVDSSGVLVFADRAGSTYTPANSGDLFAVTATFQMSKGTPT